MNYHRDQDYLKNESLFRNIFEKRVNIISRYITKGCMLEIGSSTGAMLSLFKKRGWEVTGVEPSGSADEAEKKGLEVLKVKFEEAKLSDNRFDLVVLNHTLEHFDKPEVALEKIRRVLKSGGFVFIDVPNFGSLSSHLLGRKWPYLLPEEHKSQFTRKGLSGLLKNNGFKVVHWESRSGFFEYAHPWLELKRKRYLIDLLLLPYSSVATLLKMGDSMSFMAQKQ